MSSLLHTISPSRHQPRDGDPIVFGGPQKTVKGLDTLLRLFKLDQALPIVGRTNTLEKLASIWKKANDNLTNTSVESTRKSVREDLAKLGAKISSVYQNEIDSEEDFGGNILRCLKDTRRAMISPLKKSCRGQKGPTFLISYPSSKGVRAYVLKYNVELAEPIAGLVYDAFSNGFSVPFSSRLDLELNTHETPAGQITEMDDSTGQRLRLNLSALIDEMDDLELDITTSHAMIMERVPGKNIFDFIYTKYKFLTPKQREKFFERLGRLAMLDILMGNTDRLFGAEKMEKDDYELDSTMEANLGNVMVDYAEDKENFQFFAIDNGPKWELISDKKDRIAYLKFLEKLFSTEDPFSPITDNVITCFRQALASQIDELNMADIRLEFGENANLQTVRNELKLFQEDLETIAPTALHLGLAKMAGWLRQESFPKNLKNHIGKVAPLFLEAIEERFNIFLKAGVRK